MADNQHENSYQKAFEKAAAEGRGLFLPFVMLGDPDIETSLQILRILAEAGVDALELGLPYSDPVADGETIQRAGKRALESGVRTQDALDLAGRFHAEYPELPLGLLVYANQAWQAGGLEGEDSFFARANKAGIDSVLVPDAPSLEIKPWSAAARAAGVSLVMIAPPNMSEKDLDEVAKYGEAYTYCVARRGVTGADTAPEWMGGPLFDALAERDAPPPVLGFGISKPEHVKNAMQAGAAGAISGSAVIDRIEANLDDMEALKAAVTEFVQQMIAATKRD